MTTFRHGDFLRICDVCGFQYHARDTIKRWDGAWVCRPDWEPRHPQDFVRGRKDNQNVTEPRPDTDADTFVGVLTTTATASAVAGATSISVVSSTRMEAGDDVGIILEDGTVQRSIINTVPTSTSITLTTATKLRFSMASGALILDYDAVSTAAYE